jgi:RNA polymerase sigma-70 factor (ECF subfamily)
MTGVTPGDASFGALGAETSAPSDADLLRAHVDGDPRAFAELVRRHRDRLWAVALRTIGDREEAADAVQDALLAAHRNAARFRGESAVTTWLHRIVVNACLDRIRRRQAHPTVPLPDGTRSDERPSGVEPAAPMHDHDTALVVRQALAALPVDQRAAIVLVDVEGYPVAEAAQMLGVAEGTIKSRCARGRARMAIALKHLRGEPGQDHGGDHNHGGDQNHGGGGGLGHSQGGDTGYAGTGNHGAAGSVPSGPASHVSRPGAQERRDQR